MDAREIEVEVLAVRGRLAHTGTFKPQYCYSTRRVQNWPREVSEKYFLELADDAGRVLAREGVSLAEPPVCDDPPTTYWDLRGYIALRPQAVRVRVADEFGPIWEDAIGEAPKLKVEFTRPIKRVAGAPFRFEYSPPRPQGGYLQVTYLWGQRGGAILGQFEPAPSLRVDTTRLPGGPNCRFTLAYSDGLRATCVTSEAFELPLLGPELTIVKPQPNTQLLAGQPLELEGHVVDRERDDRVRPSEELTWWIGDCKIGTGAISGLMKPPMGAHTLQLRYQPTGAVAEVQFSVREGRKDERRPADEWPSRERSR